MADTKNAAEGAIFVDLLRLSYPHLSEPSDVRMQKDRREKPDEKKMRYNAQLIIDLTTRSAPNATAQLQALVAMVKAEASLKLPKNPATPGFLTTSLFGKQRHDPNSETGIRSPFKDGAKKADGSPVTAVGYGPDTIFIKVQSKFVIPCLDMNKRTIPVDQIGAVLYPGCYVRALLRARAQAYQGNDSVAIDAVALMIMRHGERMDSQVDAEALFGGLDADDPGNVASLFASAH